MADRPAPVFNRASPRYAALTRFLARRWLVTRCRIQTATTRVQKKRQMTKPLNIEKLTIPVAAIHAMAANQRSALLLLGLFLNEVNWLRKLLARAVPSATSDEPEGQANFALTVLLATTLVGKVHEGWDRITEGKLCNTIDKLPLTDELKALKNNITDRLSGKVFLRIRNSIAFHYPKRGLDLSKFRDHISDSDTTIYMSHQAYIGDLLSHISTLAGIEPLLALNPGSDYRSLESVWKEVLDVTEMYAEFVTSTMVLVITSCIPSYSAETITIANVPELQDDIMRFFVHPPNNLEELRQQLP
jgi:hypothetical protein